LGDYNAVTVELGKRPHAVYKIRYHFVTAVKYRKVLLNEKVTECIRETMKGISERYNIVIDEIGFDEDHIHIFCGAQPQYSPSHTLQVIKSITAKRVFKEFPKLKKEELWGGEFWSDGKYIGTVGDATNEEVIRRYIRNQHLDKSEVERRTGQLKLFKI
jgi:putative transposase